jgi:hypothetical protein
VYCTSTSGLPAYRDYRCYMMIISHEWSLYAGFIVCICVRNHYLRSPLHEDHLSIETMITWFHGWSLFTHFTVCTPAREVVFHESFLSKWECNNTAIHVSAHGTYITPWYIYHPMVHISPRGTSITLWYIYRPMVHIICIFSNTVILYNVRYV